MCVWGVVRVCVYLYILIYVLIYVYVYVCIYVCMYFYSYEFLLSFCDVSEQRSIRFFFYRHFFFFEITLDIEYSFLEITTIYQLQ